MYRKIKSNLQSKLLQSRLLFHHYDTNNTDPGVYNVHFYHSVSIIRITSLYEQHCLLRPFDSHNFNYHIALVLIILLTVFSDTPTINYHTIQLSCQTSFSKSPRSKDLTALNTYAEDSRRNRKNYYKQISQTTELFTISHLQSPLDCSIIFYHILKKKQLVYL